ncbi:MAG: helix-turn-helix domain-containing protein [Defluviitaleaceae bacterium]|nr:helix-turn-helix domain-containing protein [Defluviitaleaceae bacterium]
MTLDELKAMGERMKKCRKALGYTQEDIAKMLGIQPNSYTRIETAVNNPSLMTFISIATILNTSLDYLVYGSDSVNAEILKKVLGDISEEDFLRVIEVCAKLASTKKNVK